MVLRQKVGHLLAGVLRGSLRCRAVQRNHVTTWSPLTAAFNTTPEKKLKLSFNRENKGLFLIPELTDFMGFHILEEEVERLTQQLVEEVPSQSRNRKLVQVFDQLSDCLCRVADMADFVRVAHPNTQFASAAEDACLNVSYMVEKLNTNTEIHRALQEVLVNGDKVPTDELDQRVAQLFMFDFEQSGIHLDEDKRKKFVDLNGKINSLGTFFMQGIHKPISVPKDKLPQNLRLVFGVDGDNIQVNGLFSDHFSDLVREAAYKIYYYPDSHQQVLLHALLEARHELANLAGFSTYAERTLRGTFTETPSNVMSFLETLSEGLRPRANNDFNYMGSLKAKHGSGNQVLPWDQPYYSALARHERFHINSANLAPYFSLGSCMEGLNMLFSNLYNVTLEHVPAEEGEIWHYSVHKLAVVHGTEGTLGHIYCDFFERSGKTIMDCHFTIRGGREKEDGTYQCPAVVLMLNLPLPRGDIPSLLTPSMLENLFHEFGHAMHSMLGRTKYQHVTGTRCPTDFAEVPSVLMEFFAMDYRVLSKFARHYKTGEPLPKLLLSNLCEARKLFAASDMQLQVFYSIMDQLFHNQESPVTDTVTILKEVQNKYYGLPYVPGTAMHLRFGHLVGYGAKYYSYLMSRAIATRIWHQCFKDDPFNTTMGERYRREMLAHGGGKHPSDLVQGMLGETLSYDKLVESLLDDMVS